MNEMRPSERVYRTPELYQTILDFVGKDGIARMSPLCRDFQPWVGRYLYRHLRIERFTHMLGKRKFWTDEYCAQVLHVDANQIEEHIRGRYDCITVNDTPRNSHSILSVPALRYIQQKCPKLRMIYQRNNYYDHQSRWQVQFEEGGRIMLFQTRDANFWLDRELVKGSAVEEAPLPERDMTGINQVITLGISDGYKDSRTWLHERIPDGMNRYREWLIEADDLPANVIRLHLNNMPISLDQVTQMCVNRVKHGGRHMEEIRVDSLYPFDLASFEQYLDKTGQYLRVLILSHIQSQHPHTPLLRLTQLSRVVDIVKQKCPVYQRLELYFSRAPGGGITLDEVIPISTSPYDGTLHFVGFHLHDEHVYENPDDIPLFALARNMACLGGPGCYYETRLIDREEEYGTSVNGNSEQLASLITHLQRLPPHVAIRMRAANFHDLYLDGPDWKQLLELEYESDGTPIKCITSHLRAACIKVLVGLELQKRSTARLVKYWDENGIDNIDEAKTVQSIKRRSREEREKLSNMLTQTEELMTRCSVSTEFEGRNASLAAQIEEEWAAESPLPTITPNSSDLTFFGSILPGWPGSETWPPLFYSRRWNATFSVAPYKIQTSAWGIPRGGAGSGYERLERLGGRARRRR